MFLAIGQFILALGVFLDTFWCALLGKFFYGIGIEFICICLQYYAVIYFRGTELSMVMCVTVAVSRLGSSAIYEMASPLLEFIRSHHVGTKDTGIALFIAGGFTVTSVMSSLVLFFMSPREPEDAEQKQQRTDRVRLSDVLHFDFSFWLAVTAASCNCVNLYAFVPFSQAFFMTRHGITMEEANTYSSFLSLVGAALAPVIGTTVDRAGRELSFLCLGFSLGVASHLILAFTTVTPYLSMSLLAGSFGFLVASLTPTFANIVQQKMLGTAYGISQSVMNLFYAVFITIAGVIVDSYGYQALEIFIFGNNLVGLMCSVILYLLNARGGGSLNWSRARRRRDKKTGLKLNEVMEPLNPGT